MTVSWVIAAHGPPEPAGGVVTRYADVMATLRHPDIGVLEPWTEIMRLGRRSNRDYTGLVNLLQGMLFSPNHPEHATLRQLVRQVLAQIAPAYAVERVGAIIDAHLRQARARGQVEAMETLCRAIPTAVTADALTLSAETVAAIRRASSSVFFVYQRGIPLRVLDRLEQDALAAEAAILDELTRAQRRGETGLGRLQALASGHVDARTLAGYVFFLVLASVETLTGLLGNMLLLLLTHPAQWRKLCDNPDLAAACVEEAIRAAGPMRRAAPRVALKPLTLAGLSMPRGAIMVPDLEQAHHDPGAFADPDRFDITRTGPPNMGFGLGGHACLGASIGRLEARSFLAALLGAGPMRLPDPEPVWEDHCSFRRLARLDLVFG